jgi:cellulose biosynthesis protein BcsQ
MLITVANQKGGTGKTAIATLLALFLLENPENNGKIFPCDMDEQRSFIRRIKKINAFAPEVWSKYLIIKNYIPLPLETVNDPSPYTGTKNSYCVCDTAPGVLSAGAVMTKAIIYADLLVIPTTSDADSVLATVRVAKMHGNINPSIVVLWQTGSARDREALAYLREDKNLKVLEIPNNGQIMTNFDAGRPWWSGVRKRQRELIKKLLAEILIIKN